MIILIYSNGMNYMSIAGKKKFNANWNCPSIKLTDSFGITIRSGEFEDIVGNYYHSGTWFININVSGDENTHCDTLITSSVNITSRKMFKIIHLHLLIAQCSNILCSLLFFLASWLKSTLYKMVMDKSLLTTEKLANC